MIIYLFHVNHALVWCHKKNLFVRNGCVVNDLLFNIVFCMTSHRAFFTPYFVPLEAHFLYGFSAYFRVVLQCVYWRGLWDNPRPFLFLFLLLVHLCMYWNFTTEYAFYFFVVVPQQTIGLTVFCWCCIQFGSTNIWIIYNIPWEFHSAFGQYSSTF